MPDEPEKPTRAPRRGGDADRATPLPEGAEENERPTVSPPFDPVAFARDILKPSPPPMPAVAATRSPPADPHTRATPPQGTEQLAASRQASRRSMGSEEIRRKTPTSTLSLANARIPSNLPPRPGAEPATRKPTAPAANVDRPASGEGSTRPPPAAAGGDPSDEPPRGPAAERNDSGSAARAGIGRRQPTAAERADSRRPNEAPARPRPVEMNARIELGDYSGALEIAEKILGDDPSDIGAKACAETCRSVLRQMYAARIGPLDRVPIVMVARDQLRWLSIDHKAGFVLSLVDGVSNLEMIIDVSGMPELDTLRILSELAQQRIITLR